METSGSSNLTGTPFREMTSDGTNGIYYVPENSGTDASRVPLNAHGYTYKQTEIL